MAILELRFPRLRPAFFAAALALLSLVTTLNQQTFAVGVDVQQLSDPEQEQRARSQFKKYRCLVCQNQSIEDSDAELAADLRLIIREQVAAGKSNVEIRDFLVTRYGDWVLLSPRANGLAIWLWLFPVLLLLAGFYFVIFVWRQKDRAEIEVNGPTESNTKYLSQEEQDLLNRFRNKRS